MMKNIRGHRRFFLFFYFFVSAVQADADHVEIYLQDLAPGEGQYLEQAWKKYNPLPVIIHIDPKVPEERATVIPQKGFLESLMGTSAKTEHTNASLFNTKDIIWWGVKFCFGGGALSYFTIVYFIYRVYKIVHKLYVLTEWLYDSNDQEESEGLQKVKRVLFRGVYLEKPIITEQEQSILIIYQKLDKLLKQWGLRNYFWQEPQLDQLIDLQLEQNKE